MSRLIEDDHVAIFVYKVWSVLLAIACVVIGALAALDAYWLWSRGLDLLSGVTR